MICDVLARDCDVSLFTTAPVDVEVLETESGVDLHTGSIKIVALPIPKPLRQRFDALRSVPLARYIRRRIAEFDLLVSAYNVFDFGRPAFQFIADLSFDDRIRRSLGESPKGVRGWVYAASPIRSAYLSLVRFLSGGGRRGWMQNFTVSTSCWTRDLLATHFGLESAVVYPPVDGRFPEVPWSSREDGIVLLGRVTPSKRIEGAIEIVRRIRSAGRDLHLHILGRADDPSYARRIRALCDGTGGWARWEGPVFGDEKKKIMTHHRYGLSCRTHEAFGIAVAELVKAGCIVWVPEGGGQTEIVDHPELIYRSEADAATAIASVCANPDGQATLRAHLARRGRLFSRESAASGFAEAIQRFRSGQKAISELS